MKEARAQLDDLDAKLQALFLQRMAVIAEIADYKKAHGLGVCDPAREARQLGTASERGGALSGYNRRFQEFLLELSREYQNAHKP